MVKEETEVSADMEHAPETAAQNEQDDSPAVEDRRGVEIQNVAVDESGSGSDQNTAIEEETEVSADMEHAPETAAQNEQDDSPAVEDRRDGEIENVAVDESGSGSDQNTAIEEETEVSADMEHAPETAAQNEQDDSPSVEDRRDDEIENVAVDESGSGSDQNFTMPAKTVNIEQLGIAEESNFSKQLVESDEPEQKVLMTVEQPFLMTAKKTPLLFNESAIAEIGEKPMSLDTVMRESIIHSSPFALSNVNAGIHYTAVPDDELYGYGGGVDLDFQKGRFLLNTGVYFTRFNHTQNYLLSRVDTQLNVETDERTVQKVDSSWVLTGPNQGYYEYDTSAVIVSDTTITTTFDTANEDRQRSYRLSYIEVPLAMGYRFHMGNWGLDLYGGVVMHQFISKQQTGAGEQPAEVVREFGADLMFQPELRYLFSPHYAVYFRSSLRYPLTPSHSGYQKRFYGNIQFGLSYMW